MFASRVYACVFLASSLAAAQAPPKIETADGNLQVSVDAGQAIMLTTGDNTVIAGDIPVMIEDVKNDTTVKVAALDEQVSEGLKELMAHIDMVNESLSNNSMALEHRLMMSLDMLENSTSMAIDKVSMDVDAASAALQQELDNAMTATQKSLDKINMTATRADATSAENADDIKDVMAEIKARAACALEGDHWDEDSSECVSGKQMIVVGDIPDQEYRITDQYIWTDVYALKVQRFDNRKHLRLIISDNFGMRSGHAQTGNGCRFRVLKDGLAQREHWSHTFYRDGYQLEPLSLVNWYPAVDKWYHSAYGIKDHTFKLQQYRDSRAQECRVGWGGGRDVMAEEVDPDTVSVRQFMRDNRPSSTSWTNIADRTLSYTPKDDNSKLIVTYHDTLGTYYWSYGSGAGCSTRLLVNNVAIDSNQYQQQIKGDAGWRIMPYTVSWVIESKYVKKGTKLTLQLQSRRGLQGCLYGWANGQTHNSLAVEEITPERQKSMMITTAKALKYRALSGRTWSNVPLRALAFDKKDADSVVKITLSENIGYQHRQSSTACQFRVMVNGKSYDMTPKRLHGTPGGGRHAMPTMMVWVCTTCPKGKQTYQVQVYVDWGANSCEFGYASESGYYSIEEIAKPAHL